MHIQRIYLDTSVIGGCCDLEFAQWSNGLMKDFEIGIFKPVISELVDAEIADAPEEVLQKYAELLAIEPEIVELTPQSDDLASHYLSRKILTQNYADDAAHIALATIAEVTS